MGFMMMIVVFFLLPRAVVAAGRINEVLDTQSSVSYPENSSEKPKEVGTVEFDDVSFRYSETSEPVLEHVSFKAKKVTRLPLLVRLDLVNQRLSTLSHVFMMPRKERSRLTVSMCDIMTMKPCTI